MRRRVNLYMDPDLVAGLKRIKERDGVSESEQIRRAVRGWLEQKGGLKKKKSKRRS